MVEPSIEAPDFEPSGDQFVFIIHPIDPKKDVGRRYPLLGKILTEDQIDFFGRRWPPVYVSHITGIQSQETGKVIDGHFVAVPYTPRRMLQLPVGEVYNKIVKAGKMAERLGAGIMGLGAFASVVGDAGVTVAQRSTIAITTGDAYTVAMGVEAVLEAGRQMGTDIASATVAVVGASGAIGAASSQLLARHAGRLILVGRRERRLNVVREQCEGFNADVSISTDIASIYEADLILSATSAVSAIIEPEHLKPGAVVCDTAIPRDVSLKVIRQRDDVLVIEGCVVDVPGQVNFNFNFGYPKRRALACMAETMALTLEGR
ncbi:MAG: shikimate dehydrogenase, partial [Chloroflexi bacterium]|nr:shikimate dehydrogenase [Chloroflexota bacterium]